MYAHAIEHVHHILRRNVAGGAARIGAATQPRNRRIDSGNAVLQADQNVRQRLPVGVVAVQGELLCRYVRQQCVQQALGAAGRPRTNGVAERHLVAAQAK